MLHPRKIPHQLGKCTGKAGNFFEVYTLLCIELKLRLDDPNQVNRTWDGQLEFWDLIGNPEDEKRPKVTVTELVRATKIFKAKDNTLKRKKRKLSDCESFAPAPAHKMPHQRTDQLGLWEDISWDNASGKIVIWGDGRIYSCENGRIFSCDSGGRVS